ncbi:MAG: hypothetical protein QOG62_2409 [Thermoleophilaceae bacterium]|jgi:exodeoxyribonuclease VII small subunit|nr:hypothetical protein [Thermoleophilaceae bacterium]
MTEPTEITFEAAYDELKAITDILNGTEQVPVDQLVELLGRGKGLEQALRARLNDIEQQVEDIEAGKGVRAYKIVSGQDAGAPESVPPVGDELPF